MKSNTSTLYQARTSLFTNCYLHQIPRTQIPSRVDRQSTIMSLVMKPPNSYNFG